MGPGPLHSNTECWISRTGTTHSYANAKIQTKMIVIQSIFQLNPMTVGHLRKNNALACHGFPTELHEVQS